MMQRWLLAAATAGTLVCDVAGWRRAIDQHWRTYPKAEAQDLYKLAHQGILGSEHAVLDTAQVRVWMNREVSGLARRPEPGPRHAPRLEPLPPNGRFVRVHLRPYLDGRGDVSALMQAFVATANTPRGDTAQFHCAERALQHMGATRDVRAVLTLFAAQRRAGFSAVHHSDPFEAAYAPAYRVVDTRLAERLR